MASKILNLSLSPYGVTEVIERLGILDDNIKVASEEMISDIVEEGHKIAIENDNYVPFSGNGDYDFIAESDGNKGYVAMIGSDSVYVEFGTGDIGADNPHPLHAKIAGINPYNSGLNIRLDDMGRHYWVYPPMANVSKYYSFGGLTHGIPAGCQMYNTLIELKEVAPNIAKKHLRDAINSNLI